MEVCTALWCRFCIIIILHLLNVLKYRGYDKEDKSFIYTAYNFHFNYNGDQFVYAKLFKGIYIR